MRKHRVHVAGIDDLLAKLRVLILLVFVGWSGVADATNQRVWGYVAWWMKDEWKTLTLAHFERLVFIQIKVAADGSLNERHGWPEQWGDLQAAVVTQNVPLDLALTVFETEVFNQVFSSTVVRQRLLDEALALTNLPGVGGLHLDVEVNKDLSPEAIAGFRGFLEALSRRLKARSPAKTLSVFLPFGDYLKVYDARALNEVDHFVLQGYDAHYLDSPVAGPVSPLEGMDVVNWEKMVAAADRLNLPRSRMVMGFPLYGYEWTVPSCLPRGEHVGKGEVTTLLPMAESLKLGIPNNAQDRVARYGARVEPVSNSLYYLFVGPSGVCTVGWFEDWWSLQVKTAWIVNRNLGGIAFFPLGYDRGVLVETMLNRWKRPPVSGRASQP